jgi:hypothetical protein
MCESLKGTKRNTENIKQKKHGKICVNTVEESYNYDRMLI